MRFNLYIDVKRIKGGVAMMDDDKIYSSLDIEAITNKS
jgi:hypothetical protein